MLERDFEAEKQAQWEARKQLDLFLAGKADKPPHPSWIPSVIYRKVDRAIAE